MRTAFDRNFVLRQNMRFLLAGLCLALPTAACEAPPMPVSAGAAVVERQPLPPTALPDAVSVTVTHLREIAATGSVSDMARFASENAGFRSNRGGMNHRDYWTLKLRTGDWPMAHAGRLLDYPYAVRETPRGAIFIWPRLALLHGEEITPADARDIDGLVGPGHAAEIRAGAPWPGYILGIAEDGTWLYFVSGEG